ncbi:hypothetical protein Pint_19844 [Pistacia integerrima]|uniref:Uncharacterized protein n=1 Tax=Pistacia integerrima TaxID=434235 RepID=A0ACC0X8H1_9ROSI|nr:hypothetical protein Pint_19844 [Pistacia integerrima]
MNNYVAKLFDFSVSESIPEGETHIKDDVVMGTIGFVAPEYYATFDYNEKCDVYSFGTLLLELLTGHKILDLARLARKDDCIMLDYVKKHIQMVNPEIGGEGSNPEKEKQLLSTLVQLISKCISRIAEDRPTMMDVAKQLR